MKRKLLSLVLGVSLATGLAVIPVTAQNPPADNGGNAAGGGGGRGQGGGRRGGNFDPAAYMDTLKKELGATDEEFKVIQPKIEKITELRRAQFAGAFGGFGGRRRGGDNNGGGGGGGDTAAAAPATDNPVAKASAELKTVVEAKESTPEQIKEKLAALRAARAKAKEDMTKAQAALKDVVTVRQEAVLVSRGILE